MPDSVNPVDPNAPTGLPMNACWDTLISMLNELTPLVKRMQVLGHRLPHGSPEAREMHLISSSIQSTYERFHAQVRQLPRTAGGKGDTA